MRTCVRTHLRELLEPAKVRRRIDDFTQAGLRKNEFSSFVPADFFITPFCTRVTFSKEDTLPNEKSAALINNIPYRSGQLTKIQSQGGRVAASEDRA